MKTQACTPSDLTRQTDISFFMCGPLWFSFFKSTQAGLLLSLVDPWATPLLAADPELLRWQQSHGALSKKVCRSLEMEICITPQCALAPYLGQPL